MVGRAIGNEEESENNDENNKNNNDENNNNNNDENNNNNNENNSSSPLPIEEIEKNINSNRNKTFGIIAILLIVLAILLIIGNFILVFLRRSRIIFKREKNEKENEERGENEGSEGNGGITESLLETLKNLVPPTYDPKKEIEKSEGVREISEQGLRTEKDFFEAKVY